MDELAFKMLNWVCQNVSYRSDDGEFWFYPGETLSRKAGDCDDSSLLLLSMLRNFYPPDRVFIAIGEYRGLGHAWVELDGEILETTYTSARAVADPQNYRTYAKFNDVFVLEMWPGAMSGLFQLARSECRKLALMAEANR